MITLEQKLKALREVESIYALAKTGQRLTPDEKRPNWERIADAVLKRAIGQPVAGPPHSLDVREDAMHHEHDRRSAAVIERTLRNGLVHPDVLHAYSSGVNRDPPGKPRVRKLRPKADTPYVRHFVQYGATAIHSPGGHLQGYGFVPRQHEAAKHILLEPAHAQPEALPASNIKSAQPYA